MRNTEDNRHSEAGEQQSRRFHLFNRKDACGVHVSDSRNKNNRGSVSIRGILISILSAAILIVLFMPDPSPVQEAQAKGESVILSDALTASVSSESVKADSADDNGTEKDAAAASTDPESVSASSAEQIPVWETYDTDAEYAWICANPSLFQEDKISLASGNADLTHFMYQYGHGEIPNVQDTGLTEEETSGGIPFLYQWDERWGYETYGNTVMGYSGCGPTSLAMVIVGLTGRKDVTPYTVAQYADASGYYVDGDGTSWKLFTTGCANWGLRSHEVPKNEEQLKSALSAGQPVIISVKKGMFTNGGHIMVLAGTGASGNLIVHDPNNRAYSSRTFTYSEIEDQIAALWAFEKI